MMSFTRISTQLAALGLFVFAAILTVFTAVVYFQSSAVIKQNAMDSLTAEAHLVQHQIEALNASLQVDVERLSGVFDKVFPDGVSIDQGETMEMKGHVVAVAKSGDKVLNQEFAEVDQLSAMSGGVATIFVRSGDDFLRVTTSLKKEDGSRAFGTFLGKESPAYKPIMAGQTYRGKARLFGRDYMTQYSPIKNGQGEVVGIVFVATDYTTTLQNIMEQIKSNKIGEKGYFYIFDNKDGKNKGMMLIHPHRAHANVLSADADEHYKIMSRNKEGVLEYTSGNGSKIAAYTTVPGWEWVIVAAADGAEFNRGAVRLRNTLLVIGLLALIFTTVFFYVLVQRKLRPLSDMVTNVTQVGQGDFTVRCKYTGQDEIGMLGAGFNAMASQIGTLINEVSGSVDELNMAAARLLQNARTVEQGSHRQSEAASATAAAIEQLTVSINMVGDSVRDTETLSTQTSEYSREGAQVVNSASNEIRQIADMVVASAGKVTELGETSNRISNIVQVIKDIAEQTNLLALNAAIEAARAGEQGRGFAVVADEVRKLAERTSKATAEISGMIGIIQSDMNSAVNSMQAGSKQVGQGVELASQAAVALESINDAARQTLGKISEIAGAMQEQSTASHEIAQHVEQIAGMADENNAAVNDTGAAAMQLESLASGLRSQLSRFRV